MLGLKLATDPRWVNLAEKSMEDILTDHAYCEQKAASTCISLIQQYPDKEELVEKLAPLVTEEWGHFRQVLGMIKQQGVKLGRQRKDEYVNELMKMERKGGSREEQLMEKLLIAALIEARSCERFRLLASHFKDKPLYYTYHNFMVAEAGHYRLFIDLAALYLPANVVKKRWQEYIDGEAEIMKRIEIRGDRVH